MKTDASEVQTRIVTADNVSRVEPTLVAERVVAASRWIAIYPGPWDVTFIVPGQFALTYEQVAQLRDQLDFVLSNRPTEGTV